MKETRGGISEYDGARYDKLMQVITAKKITKSQQDLAIFEAEEIFVEGTNLLTL